MVTIQNPLVFLANCGIIHNKLNLRQAEAPLMTEYISALVGAFLFVHIFRE
jgi:hypothetical protein